jgi:monofunctional biosynthetic peptidoglycan transglycosylase
MVDKFVDNFRTATNATGWQVVNDDVMGGVSRSAFGVRHGVAVFQGVVSLENNGGFASVRSLPARHDLKGSHAFAIRARGDGRRYKFTVRTDHSFDSPLYQAAFTTKPGAWQEHCLPFQRLVATFRGRILAGEPPPDPAEVASVGFLISDQQAGPFRLEIARIKALCPATLRL